MANEITIRGSDSASGSRGFPWPVLEAGNGSFPKGVYSVELTEGNPGQSFRLIHKVAGARLIEDWISAGRILFVCTVASPVSAYRRVHHSKTPIQEIMWEPDSLGSPPLFTPMIVSSADLDHMISAEYDGVSPSWDGKTIRLLEGSRVAVCPTFALRPGLIGLFDFQVEDDFAAGRFKVQPSTEEGFRFRVFLAKDLFDHLKYQRQEPIGANIMTHIVSSALSHLKRDYRDDDGHSEGWQSFSSLKSLADMLDSRDLGHWSDEDFDPEWVATCLYPHRIA